MIGVEPRHSLRETSAMFLDNYMHAERYKHNSAPESEDLFEVINKMCNNSSSKANTQVMKYDPGDHKPLF